MSRTHGHTPTLQNQGTLRLLPIVPSRYLKSVRLIGTFGYIGSLIGCLAPQKIDSGV